MSLNPGTSSIATAVRTAWCGFAISALCLSCITAMADGVAAPDATVSATAHATPGAILGVVIDASQLPVARATVTAVSADGASFRAVLTGIDGSYALSDLPAGSWSITAQIDGAAPVTVQQVVVETRTAKRFDIVMNGVAPALAPNAVQSATAATATAEARPAQKSSSDSMSLLKMLQAAYRPSTPAIRQAPGATTAAAPAAPAPTVPEALQAPEPAPAVDNDTPFAFGDFTWVNGGTRQKAPTFDTKFFTPEIRFDMNYLQDFNHPVDHTIVGSTEEFRADEFQVEQVSFGGDFHWNNVKARFLSMMGLFATATPPNDASAGVGQWDLHDAYKYLSEANAGYHFDVNHGLNIDAGIFMSYIGLFSYYNFDNWTYQPSFVSSNTPWFFNGVRIQWFPTNKLKIEPWIINGWQSYAKYNTHIGLGGQIIYTPTENLKLIFNNYGLGEDNLSSGNLLAGQNPSIPSTGPLGAAMESPNPNAPAINYENVSRIHTDDSILYRYYESHGASSGISKGAVTFTFDIGCEYGGGVTCFNGVNKENFVGAMLYDRTWFDKDIYALTVGGGFMNNPGRYLALTPEINGASAQFNSPYFTQAPGDLLYQWDMQVNLNYMPNDWITWWTETTFRHSNVPYFAGSSGVTPFGGNNGSPGSLVCQNGTAIAADSCMNEGGVWYPDLRTREFIWGAGVMVRF